MTVSASVPSTTCQNQPPPSGAATARTRRLPSRVSPSTADTASPSSRLTSDAGRTAAAKDDARSTTADGSPAVGSTGTWPPGGVGSGVHGVRRTTTRTNAMPRTTAVTSAARAPDRPAPLTCASLAAADVRPADVPRAGDLVVEVTGPPAVRCASAGDAAGAVVAAHRVQAGDLHRLAGGRGVDHLAVADVHPDVADRAVEEHQVTGLQLRPR